MRCISHCSVCTLAHRALPVIMAFEVEARRCAPCRKETRMSGSLSSGGSKFVVVALAAALLWLPGCATVSAPSATGAEAPLEVVHGEDGEAHAKRVFVYQSHVADALLDRYPLREDFVAAEPALLEAESRMTDACGPLARAVVRHMEGRKQSVKQKLKVARSLDGCELAARRVEVMMQLPPSGGLVATGGP